MAMRSRLYGGWLYACYMRVMCRKGVSDEDGDDEGSKLLRDRWREGWMVLREREGEGDGGGEGKGCSGTMIAGVEKGFWDARAPERTGPTRVDSVRTRCARRWIAHPGLCPVAFFDESYT